MKIRYIIIAALIMAITAGDLIYIKVRNDARQKVVRCAVIGGMTMTGMWGKISKMFENDTGIRVEVFATGPRPILDKAIRDGNVDLLTMHSGDITTDLIADGIAVHMRPWTRNQLVIVGPTNDPAGIRGMTNGAEAFRKIAETKSHFVDFEGIGSREMSHTLWRKAGVEAKGEWYLKDDTTINKWNILQFCRSNNAYVVVGYMPVLTGKMTNEGIEILVKDDPTMRRPYIVVETNPKKFSGLNYEGAKKLSDYLLSVKVQRFLLEYGSNQTSDRPFFFPVQTTEIP